MKKLIILPLLLLTIAGSAFANKKDTTAIEFNDRGTKKRILVLSDSKNLNDKKTQRLSLDGILNDAGVDSTNRKRTLILIESGNKRDTVVAVNREGKNIKIVIRDFMKDNGNLSHEPRRSFDNNSGNDDEYEKPSQNSDRSNRTERAERDYDADANNNDSDDSDQVRKKSSRPMNDTYDRDYDDDAENENVNTGKGKKSKKANNRYFNRKDFGLYYGLNGFNESKNAPTLNTWNSRFVALSWRRNSTIIKSKNADVALSLGPEIAWNNFRFKGNDFIDYQDGGQAEILRSAERLEKSKLVVPTLNVPIILQLGLKQSKVNIGVGVYYGYRYGGYTRIKTDNDSERYRSDFGMNTFKHGRTLEIGKKNGISFFLRRDTTPLFKDAQTNFKNVTSWNAGVRL